MKRHPYDMLDLKALRCSFAMAKLGSLTKAGLELDIAVAAVSQRVKGLEAKLGTKLYEARGGHARLEAVLVPHELGAESRYGVVLRRDKRIGPLLKSLVDILVPK